MTTWRLAYAGYDQSVPNSRLATKTLLFIGEGNRTRALLGADRVPEGMPLEIVTNYGEPWFRASDKGTGDVLWEVELPGGTTGGPMTYLHDGKQLGVSHAPQNSRFRVTGRDPGQTAGGLRAPLSRQSTVPLRVTKGTW